MSVKLRVLHGTLRHQHGGQAGAIVDVHGRKFVIGSGMDCNLRCPSSSISPHHCEIVPDRERFFLRDLASATGTFVNGERLSKPHELQPGDILRVGRLEFEVLFEASPAPAAPAREADPVGDSISDMLVEADKAAQAERMHDPAMRRFSTVAPTPAAPAPEPAESRPKKPQVPVRAPPRKLPPPPPVVADSTVEAAEEVLKKFFEKPKK